MPVAERLRVTADDGTGLAVEVHGAGDGGVLLVHGWMVSSAVWSDVTPALVARGLTVATFDLRGSGRSDRPSSGYTLRRHAADVRAVVDALGWGRFTIAGHSMGGAIVQRYVSQPGARTAAQVLVAPVPADGVELPADTVAEFRAATSSPRVAEDFMRAYAGATLPDERWRAIAADCCGVAPAAVSEGLDAWRGADFAADLDGIVLPTLVVAGADDPNFTATVLRDRVVARWPGAELVVLLGANHYVPIDAPEPLADAVARFVRAGRART